MIVQSSSENVVVGHFKYLPAESEVVHVNFS